MSLSSGLPLVQLSAVPDGGAVLAADERVVVAKRGARVSAFQNRCPHAGYPLQRVDGRVIVQEERFIVCGVHGASFDVETGACVGGPCNGEGLTPVAVTVCDGELRIA